MAGIYSPKIIDFGLAYQPIQPSDNQRTLGPYTENYVAPERLRGESRKSAADIFSLEVISYELLTGTLPYENLFERLPRRDIVPLTQRRENVGLKIAELIDSMLADDPAARPTAAYVAAALPEAAAARDWKECRERAVNAFYKDDYETAMMCYKQAIACRPEQQRTSSEFADVLRDTFETAMTIGQTHDALLQFLQPSLQVICQNGA